MELAAQERVVWFPADSAIKVKGEGTPELGMDFKKMLYILRW